MTPTPNLGIAFISNWSLVFSAAVGEMGGRRRGSVQNPWRLYFDGAARNNPNGIGAYGFVLEDSWGNVREEGSEFLGFCFSSNASEYKGLIAGLQAAQNWRVGCIEAFGDSQLVVKQVNGEYNVYNPRLARYRETVLDLIESFRYFSLEHVPRSENTHADQLAFEGLSKQYKPCSDDEEEALEMCDEPGSAWDYLLEQRIYGVGKLRWLLYYVIRENYPHVFNYVKRKCVSMDHVDQMKGRITLSSILADY